MTAQLKNDIRTIIEVSSYLSGMAIMNIAASSNSYVAYFFFAVSIVSVLYRFYEKIQYRRGKRPDMIRFPTQNDDYSKMTFVTFGILILAFSLIGFFAFSIKAITFIIGLIAGMIVILLGTFNSSKGWMNISHYSLQIFNNHGDIDIRQLKEIILKNDMISFVNIYGERKNSTLLKLDPLIASDIKNFLGQKLLQNKVSILDHVQ